MFPTIQGYSMVGNQPMVATINASMNQGESVQMVKLAYQEEKITAEDMRQALAQLVKSKIFWGKGAVKSMEIVVSGIWNCYYCVWETFSEKRDSAWKTRPYKGGPIDGPENGPVPQPWDIPIVASRLFADETKKVRVPHTEYGQGCPKCFGRGHVQCRVCHGSGSQRCTWCSGSGVRIIGGDRTQCSFCHGSGHDQCNSCHGRGMRQCKECDGHGQIVYYIEVTASFTNHIEYRIIDGDGLPDDLVDKAKSSILAKQEGYRILPPQDVFDPKIREACSTLFTNAENFINSGSERLLQERVTVKVIPMAKATGSWKGKSSEFWVYGNDKVAYAPRYNKEFYHGCSIL